MGANKKPWRSTKDIDYQGFLKQGRQDSNLQPPVLETGALPIVLLPFGWAIVGGQGRWSARSNL